MSAQLDRRHEIIETLLNEVEWKIAEYESYQYAVALWRQLVEVTPVGPDRSTGAGIPEHDCGGDA